VAFIPKGYLVAPNLFVWFYKEPAAPVFPKVMPIEPALGLPLIFYVAPMKDLFLGWFFIMFAPGAYIILLTTLLILICLTFTR
jgi:hypothetical protein